MKTKKALRNVQQAIEEFRRNLVLKYGHKIEAIMLYGSIVNGRYRPKESDVDIMIIAKDKGIDEDVLDLETKISLKHGVVISALLSTVKEFNEGKRAGYAYFDQVAKGKVLYERHKRRAKISL